MSKEANVKNTRKIVDGRGSKNFQEIISIVQNK